MLCYEYICGREIWEIRAKECTECVQKRGEPSSSSSPLCTLLHLQPPNAESRNPAPPSSAPPPPSLPPALFSLGPTHLLSANHILPPSAPSVHMAPPLSSLNQQESFKLTKAEGREGERGSEAGSHTLSRGGSSRRRDDTHSLTNSHTHTHAHRYTTRERKSGLKNT